MTDGSNARMERFELEISVARIEGMLTATLARHDQRLDQHEGTLNEHGTRLREKSNIIARHDERIKDLEEDNDARLGRITGTIGVILAIATFVFAMWNRMTIGV